MRARHRLVLYLALWVVALLVVPVILPPAREPSYPAPALYAGERWTYVPTSSYGGPAVPGGGSVDLTTHPSPGPTGLTEVEWGFNTSGSGTLADRWPFEAWTFSYPTGSWTSLEYRCTVATPTAASERLNLSRPLAVGLTFPLKGDGWGSSSVGAFAQGSNASPCSPGWATLSATGGYSRVLPPGGSVSCVLYVCNAYREYDLSLSLVLATNGSGSAPGATLSAWQVYGLYDPGISGFRDLSFSPGAGPSGSYANGSLNLSLSSSGGLPTSPSPDPLTEYSQSAFLLLGVPVVTLLFELSLLRRSRDRDEHDTESKVLAALTSEEKETVPPGEVYDATRDESIDRPEG